MADVLSFMVQPQSGNRVYISVVGSLMSPEEARALCFQIINAAREAEDMAQKERGGIVVPKVTLVQ
jgi:hypothetical protein